MPNPIMNAIHQIASLAKFGGYTDVEIEPFGHITGSPNDLFIRFGRGQAYACVEFNEFGRPHISNIIP